MLGTQAFVFTNTFQKFLLTDGYTVHAQFLWAMNAPFQGSTHVHRYESSREQPQDLVMQHKVM